MWLILVPIAGNVQCLLGRFLCFLFNAVQQHHGIVLDTKKHAKYSTIN